MLFIRTFSVARKEVTIVNTDTNEETVYPMFDISSLGEVMGYNDRCYSSCKDTIKYVLCITDNNKVTVFSKETGEIISEFDCAMVKVEQRDITGVAGNCVTGVVEQNDGTFEAEIFYTYKVQVNETAVEFGDYFVISYDSEGQPLENTACIH